MSTSNRSRRLSALVTLAVIATALAFVTLAAAAEFSADVVGNMHGQTTAGKLYPGLVILPSASSGWLLH
jgi:hypothetical protein